MATDNNVLHAVGRVIGVENKAARNGKTFYVAKLQLLNGTEMEVSSFDAKIHQAFNAQQLIEFGYSEQQNGQYTNRYMGNWSVKDDGGVPATSAPTGTGVAATGTYAPVSTPQTPDARSDQIVRQSSMHRATSIVCAMMQSGNLPFPKSGKGAKAASDPSAILALIFDIAGQVKEQIFNGDWEQPTDEPGFCGDEPLSEEEIPF